MATVARPGWRTRGYIPHCDRAGLVQHVVYRASAQLPDDVLTDPDCAAAAEEPIRHFSDQRYRLHAWCVMPDHVHVLIGPLEDWTLGAIVRSWKAYSAAKLNRRLGRSGRFWAADYFDRYLRNDSQLSAAARYIERNPVAAGLCDSPGEWEFSSAFKGGRA
ncbi:MAG: transposase [Hyphomonadaceae bacterium]|nr:transposase [Hyphomonadaceae bacterium]